MVILTGKNLGERHRELNNKVAEFIADKKNFNDLKTDEELTDVDKLYKIDIASQYKDVDYIVEVLKSGDSLYISRALKCLWLYNNSYSHVINVESLHVNIFPFMSIKMKKKMLTTISMYIRDNERVAAFYIYCNKYEMRDIALKFLNYSSEEFKLNVLKNDFSFKLYLDTEKNLKNFIGNSFALTLAYIEKLKISRWSLHESLKVLSYMYTVNDEKYLDIIEEYGSGDLDESCTVNRLGIRISRDIMIKHKNRILKNPSVYIKKINKNMLIKYSSKNDAKQYIISIMPQSSNDFWQINFCTTHKYILDLIPMNEKFEFMKQLFTTKYPGEDFEMAVNFYSLKYYNMLSIDQRELWALRHIDEGKEIFGFGKDYIWYKFVNIDKALIEVKKYIFNTPHSNERSNIVNILVEAAKDQNDLLKVLNYYNDRHMNENIEFKEEFIDKVLSVHNVFEFNIECWEALNNILYSLEIYTTGRFGNQGILAVAVVCHILHNKDMPQVLTDFINLDINYTYFSPLLEKLGNIKSEIVFQYLLNIFVDKLKPYENEPLNRNIKKSLKKYINNIHNLTGCFNKAEEDVPDIVKKIMDIISPKPKKPKVVTAKDIFTYLKKDTTQAIDILSHFDRNINDWPGTSGKNVLLNSTFRKLKVYFQNDVAQEYIKFFDRVIPKLSNDYGSHQIINSVIFGIFQLADTNYKVAIMEKYKPLQHKINHNSIDRKLLGIQEAICRFVGYSRPSVPLNNVLQYLKGDYVHYCLPIFNMYSVNLPPSLIIKFTNEILNMPLSVQKHGLRLAFKWYSNENLKALLLSTWEKSKNISLRKIIYKSLYDKITRLGSDHEDGLSELYEVLRFFTSDLCESDDEDIFITITNHNIMPDKFIDSYLRTAWDMVIKLPSKPVNINRQTRVISAIKNNIHLIKRDFIYKQIIEDHVHVMLEQRKLKLPASNEFTELCDQKWKLTRSYIIQYSDNEEMEQSFNLMSLIFKICVEMWNEKYEGCRIFRKFYFDFISDLKTRSLSLWYKKQLCNIPIFERILDMLLKTFPLKEIYLIVWDLKLTIYSGMSVGDIDSSLHDRGEKSLSQSPEQYLSMISHAFANHVGKFVKKLLADHQFYAVFLPEIAKLVEEASYYFDIRLNRYTSVLMYCESLANLEMKEIHLLILMVLDTNKDSFPEEDLRKILKKIQAFENEEVQSYMNQIYGNIL